jgi:ligand-binding sensor domain-containing protein
MKEAEKFKQFCRRASLLLFFTIIAACKKTGYDLLDPSATGIWTNYNSDNSEVPGDLVWDLKMDGQNRLWVSFLGEGIGVYSAGSWIFYNTGNSDILNDYITTFEPTPVGDMLMGTGDGLCMITKDGEWFYYQDPNVTTMDIIAIKYSTGGDTWVGTDGEGFYVDWGGSGFVHYKYTGYENVNTIEEDSNGNIWLGTNNGLLKYDGDALYPMTYNLPSSEVSVLFLDSQNRLWVGTSGGQAVAWISESGNLHQLMLRNGPSTYVKDIYEDRKGDLWFATWFDGLIKYDGIVPNSYKEYNGFYEDYVNCIMEDNVGNLWFGLWSKGLVRYTIPLDNTVKK